MKEINVVIEIKGGAITAGIVDNKRVRIHVIDHDNDTDYVAVENYFERVKRIPWLYSALNDQTGGELYFAGRNSKSVRECEMKVATALIDTEQGGADLRSMSSRAICNKYDVTIVKHIAKLDEK